MVSAPIGSASNFRDGPYRWSECSAHKKCGLGTDTLSTAGWDHGTRITPQRWHSVSFAVYESRFKGSSLVGFTCYAFKVEGWILAYIVFHPVYRFLTFGNNMHWHYPVEWHMLHSS